MEILDALLDLNKVLMLNGFGSDFSIQMEDDDFEKFVYLFEKKYQHFVNYPELNPFLQAPKNPMSTNPLKDINFIKIAGPGSYFTVSRRKSPETSV